MPQIFIDNKPYEVKDGQNLLHAALSHGFDVPYFCWHPALGSVGACRQCAVQVFKDENDTKGRMVMSCMTPAGNGTRLSVDHPECKEFRASVIEWMMTNHPHDCPVCDEGGECHLQDMTLMTGHNYRRYRFKKRTFRNQNLGPFINHEMNRCITCYRCVRFYRDVAGGNDLNSFASSNRVYFGRHEDGVLENEFSGNLVEICPTGVFTDKPFKSYFNRKWDLQMAPSVCQLCSLGCNIIPGERYGSLRRIQNRYHDQINGYFLCDRGRFGHSFVNSEERLLVPTGENDRLQKLLSQNQKIIGIASPRASLEANFALRTLVGEDNFYNGLSSIDSLLMSSIAQIVKEGPAKSASVHDVVQADAILVLGEDLTNTAPRLALAVRQSAHRLAEERATQVNVAAWHDLAVRNWARDKSEGIFVAAANATKLDDVATELFHSHPDQIAAFGQAIARELGAEVDAPLDDLHQASICRIADILSKAKRPVVISGSSLQSDAIVKAAANVAWALCQRGIDATLAYALPEANSMGLALLGAKPMSEIGNDIEAAIVLENDLSRRMALSDFQNLKQKMGHLVVLDSFRNKTVASADVAIPVCTFAEGSGTLVNNEARVQRYYGVFERKERIPEAWRVLRDWIQFKTKGSLLWKNLDNISDDMCQKIPELKPFGESAYRATFRIGGQRIARETLEYSGRTAMYADTTMHEPKPVVDLDSPLTHSMEGHTGHPPAALTPFFWAPGWNSTQALNKYQEEIGGPLKDDHAGVRLFDQKKLTTQPFFKMLSNTKRTGSWQLVPRHHIFGSEERAPLSKALAQRIQTPYLGLCAEDLSKLGINSGDTLTLSVGKSEWRLVAALFKELKPGSVFMPVGLPQMGYVDFSLPAEIRVEASQI